MKKAIITIIILLTIVGVGAYCFVSSGTVKNDTTAIDYSKFQDGDIIFQVSQSSQCRAIQLATNSKYSHCGIIFKKDDKYFVYEAVQPVVITQLGHWIKRGKDEHYVVKRLKDASKIITSANKKTMITEAEKHMAKNYDLTFEWSDDKMYCSELVWKIYQRGTGIEIGKLQQLKEFDLSHPDVQSKVFERYSDNIPLDELVISPIAIFNSPLLYTISEN